MRKCLACLTAASCLLPLSASAALVSVTSHTSGTIGIGSPALSGSPQVMGTDPFALRDLAAGAGLSGSFDLALWPQNPEIAIWWRDGADSQVATLQVVSAVPAPAAPALLAAGLLVLAMRTRQQRKRPCCPAAR